MTEGEILIATWKPHHCPIRSEPAMPSYTEPEIKREIEPEIKQEIAIKHEVMGFDETPDAYLPIHESPLDTKPALETILEPFTIADFAEVQQADDAENPIGIITSDWSGNWQFGCPYYPCSKGFPDVQKLKEHMQATHQDSRRFRCLWRDCGRTLSRNDEVTVTEHTRSHLLGRKITFPGPIPEEYSDSSSNNSDHSEGWTEVASSPRPKRNKTVPSNDSTQASAIARDRYRTSCKVCGTSIITPTDLKIHMRTHTGERPFKCPVEGCHKTFTQKGHQIDHTRTHDGRRPFVCDWEGCGKAFKQRGHIIEHRKSHTGERPFRCSWTGCKCSFTKNSNLQRHILTHTREKPFKCTWSGCRKSFSQKSSLTVHIRTHTGESRSGEKPFKCKECDKLFSQRCNLNRHIKKHCGSSKTKSK